MRYFYKIILVQYNETCESDVEYQISIQSIHYFESCLELFLEKRRKREPIFLWSVFIFSTNPHMGVLVMRTDLVMGGFFFTLFRFL